MNAQFRNSNFGFFLYTAIIAIIILSTSFVIWYMTIGFKVGTYGPDTRLGSVYIGGLRETEVEPLLEERIAEWYNDDTIVFQLEYQGYTYEFDRDEILFDFELSAYELQDGITNNLVAYFQPEDLERIRQEIADLPYLANVINDVDITQLLVDTLSDASYMKAFSNKHIEDYFVDLETQYDTISTSSFRVPEGVQINDVIDDINALYEDGRVPINGKELFDVLEVFSTSLNDQEITMLSSAMLEAILPTNFIVNETHYNPTIDFTIYTVDSFPFYGRNTEVNRIVNESFSFYNPNEFTYYFTVEKTDEFNGQVTLIGVPFEYDINVDIQKTELPYISQSTSNVSLLQIGYEGAVVEVVRTITDVNGVVIKEDVILFEFYPPIKEIIFEP